MSSNIDKLVLSYLQRHPYSKPREIADGLGFSIVTVRYSLLRLRERGLVVRTSRGYIARTHAKRDLAAEETQQERSGEPSTYKEVAELRERILEIEKILEDALENLSRLEKEVSELRVFIRALQGSGAYSRHQRDPFIEKLSREGLMTISEARKEASKTMGSLEYYVDRGDVAIVGEFVVDKRFYENLMSRMPMKVEDMNSLSAKEKILVEAMISEGVLYIDKGREIRPV